MIGYSTEDNKTEGQYTLDMAKHKNAKDKKAKDKNAKGTKAKGKNAKGKNAKDTKAKGTKAKEGRDLNRAPSTHFSKIYNYIYIYIAIVYSSLL